MERNLKTRSGSGYALRSHRIWVCVQRRCCWQRLGDHEVAAVAHEEISVARGVAAIAQGEMAVAQGKVAAAQGEEAAA